MARTDAEHSAGMSEEGDKVRTRRERLGLTQVDLHKTSGVHRTTIAAIEEGKGFRMGTLRKIERALADAELEAGIGAPGPPDESIVSFEIRMPHGGATVIVQGPVADADKLAESVARMLGEVDGPDQD